MNDFNLSPHFSYFEMTRTNHRAYLNENRKVHKDEELIANGHALCAVLLEPIRVHYGKPVIIHSGYRCPGLNTAIGSTSLSQHRSFQAVDFHVSGVDLDETFKWIWKDSGLPYGQLIGEGISAGRMTWIHLSLGEPWRDKNKCRQVLTWNKNDGYVRLQ